MHWLNLVTLFQVDPTPESSYRVKDSPMSGWTNLRIPSMATTTLRGNIYEESYELNGLVPDSSYEARVAAENEYGLSQESLVFHFYTQGKGEPSYAYESV